MERAFCCTDCCKVIPESKIKTDEQGRLVCPNCGSRKIEQIDICPGCGKWKKARDILCMPCREDFDREVSSALFAAEQKYGLNSTQSADIVSSVLNRVVSAGRMKKLSPDQSLELALSLTEAAL